MRQELNERSQPAQARPVVRFVKIYGAADCRMHGRAAKLFRIDILANMSGPDEERLLQLLSNHHAYTGSTRAREVLDGWANFRTRFVKVMPVEYRRALREMELERYRTLQAAE